jgi:hypothetical protein
VSRAVIDGVGNYKCDWCKANHTAQGSDHFSIEIGERSGLASLHGPLPGWRMANLIKPGRYHFCGPACLAKWVRTVTYVKTEYSI